MKQATRSRTLARYSQFFPCQLLSPAGSQYWHGFWVEQCQTTDFETPTVAYTNHFIAIQLSGTTTVSYTPSYSLESYTASSSQQGILPQGVPHKGLVKGNSTWIAIHLDHEFMAHTVHEVVNGERLQILTQIPLHDPLIWEVGNRLAQGIDPQSQFGHLYAESLASTLAIHLIQNYSAEQPNIRNYKGGLSDLKLKQIINYIQAHLDQEIRLVDLAELSGMSRYYFSRLFRKSMGLTPYQYVIHLRVERAKSMLKGNRQMAIAEIALACGFTHQSHLNKVFLRLTGVTPRAYRQG
ncbi:helix-turn-helix domain-containing protein [Acaryochloris marina]|uniref:helix-turn-helix domain-containing protein n=1 Tax=Acaryochloris marina TaxID=155978 RepID=UPI0021C4192E|nr:helix-turn-helix domain-containing protein [Acaryochloris marina]BDM83768.1 hypothetical protein AM10699_66290 [Acaryochloris marina MBIC10699]